jgi:esterase/lipase
MIKDVTFLNNKNQKISARIYSPADQQSLKRTEFLKSIPGVIFCHGLFSSKKGYKITQIAEDFTKAGFILLTFDFSFCGESEGKLADLSVIQEVEDLRCAVNYFKRCGINEIHLLGSSMGGTVSILFCSENDPVIKSLSVIAAPVKLLELMRTIAGIENIDKLPKNGMTSVHGVMINDKFFLEMKDINMKSSIRKMKKPVLIIHGDNDSTVDISNAQFLFENLSVKKKLTTIKNGNHYLKNDLEVEIIRKEVIDWIQSNRN